MRPTFPSWLVGDPIERANAYVYPLYFAQLNLFDKFHPKPSWSVADTRQKQKVLAINQRLDGPKYPSIVNRTDGPLLFLPGDRFAGTLHLTCCSILVPPKTIIRIPSLCYVSFLRLTGSPLWPPENAVGFAACGAYKWEMNLFGNQDACKEAGWRRTTLHGKPATAAARQDVETFVHLVHRLDFQRVKSTTPGCTEWVASGRGVQASALFYKKQFVHLHSVRTLRGEVS
jgi:hypothetical protein